jgi:hypothetical protein
MDGGACVGAGGNGAKGLQAANIDRASSAAPLGP